MHTHMHTHRYITSVYMLQPSCCCSPQPLHHILLAESAIYPTPLCVATLGRWCHPTGYLVFYCPFLILPSIFPSIRDFSSESGLCIWWPKYQSVQFSRSVVSDSLQPHESQHSRPPCPSPTPGVYINTCPSSHDAIQPSHPLLSPSPPTSNLSQHQGLFQ